MHANKFIAPLAAALSLAACGGGSSDTTTDTSAAMSFPTGVAIGSPADLSTGGAVVVQAPVRYAADWGRAMWKAALQGNGTQLARLGAALLPLGNAHAAPSASPEFGGLSALIERVLEGDATVDLATVIDFQKLFAGGTDAPCYGPSIDYSSHQDASGAEPTAGRLPSGDLGLWNEYQGPQPCVAAQFSRRIAGVKGRGLQGLVLSAAMRLTVARSSSLAMPAAGASTDLATEFQALLRTVPAMSAVNVRAATLSLDSTGSTYTYRLVLNNGASGAAARSGEVLLRHTPGSTPVDFTGVLQVAGFTLGTDPAFGCTDAIDSATGQYQRAHVSTLKYSRAGTQMDFGSRDGSYCGHPNATTISSNQGAEVAAFTSDGQLDPNVKLTGNTRGSSVGWRGNFSRFAGSYDRTTVAGNFLYAWQAGGGDGNARALALNSSYNSVTEVRALQGFFAFTADIGTSDGTLLGMICNWAGPGNSHATSSRFQLQVASLAPTATEFTVDSSRITYAPTNSCSSSTTQFDANADNTLAAGEGVGTASDLDAPGGALTVQQEIDSRGYSRPSMY